MQHHGLFADLLTFLAIFLAINTPSRGQNMTRHTPLRPSLFFFELGSKVVRKDVLFSAAGEIGVLEEIIFCGSLVTPISRVVFKRCTPQRALPKVFHRKIRGDLSFSGRKIAVKMKIGRVPWLEGCFVGATDGYVE